MSKVLYPKPKQPSIARIIAPKENPLNRPYHVFYNDLDNPTGTTVWRHYNSELAVKLGAWFICRVIGFTPAATLYSRDEMKAISNNVTPKVGS